MKCSKMSLSKVNNETLLRYYHNIHSMVALASGTDLGLVLGEAARKRARDIEEEMTARRLTFIPLVWPDLILSKPSMPD
jgi:hypothetical protein